jgi:hypothetical protein
MVRGTQGQHSRTRRAAHAFNTPCGTAIVPCRAQVTPAFSFGHGLSYSMFVYSGLQLAGRTVSFDLATPAGGPAVAEVAQLYLVFPSSAGEPPLQLKGFQKLALHPGAAPTRVTFVLADRCGRACVLAP